MGSRDEHIREIAYQLWEAEGRPEGQQIRHWETARIQAAKEDPYSRPKRSVDPSEARGQDGEPEQPDQT